MNFNSLGQPVGDPVPHWSGCPTPPRVLLAGRYCRIEPLEADRHAAQLFSADSQDVEGRSWTYLSYGPFATLEAYRTWMQATCTGPDPLFFAILDSKGEAVGVASYLRIDAANGSIEVGHLHFSPRLQQTVAATEAMYLMMKNAFDLGYRRYEWKCNDKNAASMRAARRLGFTYEGTFRQTGVLKGRNRNTAWLSIVDTEWPAIRAALEAWLDPANFDTNGRQRKALDTSRRIEAVGSLCT